MDNNKDPDSDSLKKKAKDAPDQAGVYLWKDDNNTILYVGKAKSLKSRLASYFAKKPDIKTRHLMSKAVELEWILTNNEYEALLLENNLIKENTPRYNVSLKDGKTYPSIRITNEPFPRVFRTRRIINDGSTYFGPYPSVETIDIYLNLIKKNFPLRQCKKLRKRDNPCMYYHIGRCSAPCAGKITLAEYSVHIANVISLLSGKTADIIQSIHNDMRIAAQALDFEKAASLRDLLKAIESFRGESAVVDYTESETSQDKDYVAWAFDGSLASFVVFQTRGGKLVGRDLFRERCAGTESEAAAEFIRAYYGFRSKAPATIFVKDTEGLDLTINWLHKERDANFTMLMPHEKKHIAALSMAEFNAKEDIVKRRRETGNLEALEALRTILNLDSLPDIIEGFDIAHLGGTNTVASLVKFKNGIPFKKGYRTFKIKSLDGAIDDFESIKEVLARHYSRVVNDGDDLPDLILIDGGIGQVNAAFSILSALGLDIPLIGLAEKNEEVWPHGSHEPIKLPRSSVALNLLVFIRDEAHRFATGMNQRLRGKSLSFGILESVQGIGPSKARHIMENLGSLQAVAEASPEYIAKTLSVSKKTAEALQKAAKEHEHEHK